MMLTKYLNFMSVDLTITLQRRTEEIFWLILSPASDELQGVSGRYFSGRPGHQEYQMKFLKECGKKECGKSIN